MRDTPYLSLINISNGNLFDVKLMWEVVHLHIPVLSKTCVIGTCDVYFRSKERLDEDQSKQRQVARTPEKKPAKLESCERARELKKVTSVC